MQRAGADQPVRAKKAGNAAGAKGLDQEAASAGSTGNRRKQVEAAKSFSIPKQLVYEAFKAVKANAGAAGVDKQSIEDFEKSLKDNLYKIWNRMSSGTYLPPPVKAVAIPKKDGGERILGVPTVADRVAQMVVKRVFEPNVEPVFRTPTVTGRENRRWTPWE
jgi:RNA-directed DNA polymerase